MTTSTTKASMFTAWWDTYRASTTQLCALDIAVRWCQLRVPATEAAAWARLGYLPDKAATLIAAGITPAMVRESAASGVITAISDDLASGDYDGCQIRNKPSAPWITTVSARVVDRGWMPFRASDTAIEVTTGSGAVRHIDHGYPIQILRADQPSGDRACPACSGRAYIHGRTLACNTCKGTGRDQ